LDCGSEVVLNPIPNEVVRPSAEERPLKRQRSHRADKIPLESGCIFVPWTGHISIRKVQETYRSAIDNGRLKYQRVLQLESKSDTGSSQEKRWDPYVLTASLVPRALLDTEKVEDIAERVKLVTLIQAWQ
jgi:hypothetical protein